MNISLVQKLKFDYNNLLPEILAISYKLLELTENIQRTLAKAQMDKVISIYSSYLKPAYHSMYWELVLRKRYGQCGPCDEEKVRVFKL